MRWRSASVLALAFAGACAPRGTPVPTVPVVVIRDTAATPRPPAPPRDTVVITPAPAPPVANATPVAVGLIVDTSAVEIGSAGAFTVHTEDGR
ncbi:MAG TPA: hypothetical protein VK358_08675, partial [Longimicrobium sp.]|nr:hypothetical protein [Longimicrobium sp.]